jgi:hypothetical protein
MERHVYLRDRLTHEVNKSYKEQQFENICFRITFVEFLPLVNVSFEDHIPVQWRKGFWMF